MRSDPLQGIIIPDENLFMSYQKPKSRKLGLKSSYKKAVNFLSHYKNSDGLEARTAIITAEHQAEETAALLKRLRSHY